MAKESPARRRKALSLTAGLAVDSTTFTTRIGAGVNDSEEDARRRCLGAAIRMAAEANFERLVIDRRDDPQNHVDRQVTATTLADIGIHTLTYGHLTAVSETLLWIPNIVAWAMGKGAIGSDGWATVWLTRSKSTDARNPATHRPERDRAHFLKLLPKAASSVHAVASQRKRHREKMERLGVHRARPIAVRKGRDSRRPSAFPIVLAIRHGMTVSHGRRRVAARCRPTVQPMGYSTNACRAITAGEVGVP